MRSVEEIYRALLEKFKERAGFAPAESCDLAVRLWAAAAQVQALEIHTDWVLNQSFPQTAQGEYLDHHGIMRGLTRVPAAKAMGKIRFSVSSPAAMDLSIPAETVCMTAAGTRFQTTEEVVLAAGELYADTPAEAVEAGSMGNAASGTVNILTACPVAVTACTNPAAFSGGRDAEDDEAFRKRILESYQRLPNGANAAWYEQTAMAYSGVAAAKAVGRARGIGTVDVYVTTEAGLPEENLLEGLRTELQKKREIAVDVAVKAPDTTELNVTLEVAAAEGVPFSQVQSDVENAITTFFNGRLLGKPVLLAELGKLVYSLEGVANYRFAAPAEDLTANDAVLPVLGTLTVTEMEA